MILRFTPCEFPDESIVLRGTDHEVLLGALIGELSARHGTDWVRPPVCEAIGALGDALRDGQERFHFRDFDFSAPEEGFEITLEPDVQILPEARIDCRPAIF